MGEHCPRNSDGDHDDPHYDRTQRSVDRSGCVRWDWSSAARARASQATGGAHVRSGSIDRAVSLVLRAGVRRNTAPTALRERAAGGPFEGSGARPVRSELGATEPEPRGSSQLVNNCNVSRGGLYCHRRCQKNHALPSAARILGRFKLECRDGMFHLCFTPSVGNISFSTRFHFASALERFLTHPDIGVSEESVKGLIGTAQAGFPSMVPHDTFLRCDLLACWARESRRHSSAERLRDVPA